MFKVGAIYATRKGVFGMVTHISGSDCIIKWDGIVERKTVTKEELKRAVNRKLIDYVGLTCRV